MISFVMPTYNRDDLIGDSIESIVNQTVQEWELIIIDDHSDENDKTIDIISKFNDDRIKYFKLPELAGRGVSCARNYGNLLASGEIVAVCDSDDINNPNRAELIIKSREKKKWDVFYGKYEIIEGDKEPYMSKINTQIPFSLQELKKRNFIPHGSLAYTKQTAMQYPYNSSLLMAEDYDLTSRLATDSKNFYFCDQVIFKYRVHAQSITAGKPVNNIENLIKKNRGWI